MFHSVRQVFGCLLRTSWHNTLHAHCETRCVVLLGTSLYLSSRPSAHRLRGQVLLGVCPAGHRLFQDCGWKNWWVLFIHKLGAHQADDPRGALV